MVKSNYWQERFIKEEERRNKDARAYLSSIEKQYDKALRNIEKDINNWYSRLAKNINISLREAKILLSKNELEEFKWTVQEYIEKGQENAISKEWMKQLENASAKVHISKLEALKVQIQNEIEGLYGERLKGMEGYLERVYGDTYYKSAFIIQKGIGIGWSLSALDTNKVNQIIHKPWAIDGKNFSERIWEDKAKLINTLHTELTQNIIRGSAPDELIRQISKEFGVKKSAAGRLVMTESAAYSSKAQEQCFKDLDVEKYEIVATLDTSTSEICREMDGKVFLMKDYLVGVTANPFHPNCRTCTAPYFEDDVTSMRAMRTEDGKTEYVSANMKYEEWYKKYVLVGVTANPFHPNCRTCTAPYFEDDVTSMRAMRTEDGKTEYVSANMKYEEWYKKYVAHPSNKTEYDNIKTLLSSKYVPDTFEKFEYMKYNNIKDYEQLQREFKTISKIKNKEWNEEFKNRAINIYYQFRDYNYETSDHFLARFLNRKGDSLTFEKIVEILKKPVNFIEIKNEHNIRYYDLIRVITNKEDIELISVMENKKDISGTKLEKKEWVKK